MPRLSLNKQLGTPKPAPRSAFKRKDVAEPAAQRLIVFNYRNAACRIESECHHDPPLVASEHGLDALTTLVWWLRVLRKTVCARAYRAQTIALACGYVWLF